MPDVSMTTLYLLLLLPVFIFTVWHMTTTISPPPLPDSFTNKRIVLLIAHPDDESMFFSPTIQALATPELGNHVKILCLSTGDSEGLGETRKKELERAAVLLGLKQKEDVYILNDERFRDGMKEKWDEKEIARVLAQAFAPHLIPGSQRQHAQTASGADLDVKHKTSILNSTHKGNGTKSKKGNFQTPTNSSATPANLRSSTPQANAPVASIDILLTFDESGVSGHPNHKALYHGSKVFLQQVMKGYTGFACPVSLYTLSTTNIMRKYSFIMDVLPTYTVNVLSSIVGGSSKRKIKSLDDRVIFISDISRYLKAREAMVKGHESQMVWFRWGWITLGRYMVVNDLRKIHIHGS